VSLKDLFALRIFFYLQDYFMTGSLEAQIKSSNSTEKAGDLHGWDVGVRDGARVIL
jgi:hypothetical protein